MFHQPFYSQTQQQPLFHNNHVSNQFYMPNHSFFYHSTPVSNQSSHKLNNSRDFQQYSTRPHGFNSMPTGTYPFYDLTNQQGWNQNTKGQYNYSPKPVFYFQDKSTYYYMCNPIITKNNRISIQLTKVSIGPNGDQQRVFVEQEFSNENQLKNFMKNFKYNFEKTFNNCKTDNNTNNNNNNNTNSNNNNNNNNANDNTNNKLSGMIVIEEPDEEPKIYEQQVYNENIKSPLINSKQSSTILTYPTNHLKKRRRNKKKYQRQKFENENNQQNEKLSNYSHYYEPPPRFQQRFYNNKDNNFRIRNDFNHISSNLQNHWKFNGYSYPYNNQSRTYIPSINENIPSIHASTPPRFTRSKNQHKSQPSPRFHRKQQQQQQYQYRRNQPTTIAENLLFTQNKQYQTRVHRTQSECRLNIPTRNQSKIPQYLDYRPNLYHRHFTPFVSPPTPIFYPQRRSIRNIQIQFHLFNPFQPNSNRF